MKKCAKNIILVMSGGIGSRFGADCPKQYCLMDGRMIIDYVMDACRKSKAVDDIVIVSSGEYLESIRRGGMRTENSILMSA